MSGFLVVEGWRLSLFHSHSLPLILWSLLWRSTHPGIFWMMNFWILSQKNSTILLCQSLLHHFCLHEYSVFSISASHFKHTPLIYSAFMRTFAPLQVLFLQLNWDMVTSSAGIWMQHCRNPWAVSPLETWDDGSFLPFAKSSLMSHSSCRQDKALYITYRNSPLDSVDLSIEISIITLSSLSDYFRFSLK